MDAAYSMDDDAGLYPDACSVGRVKNSDISFGGIVRGPRSRLEWSHGDGFWTMKGCFELQGNGNPVMSTFRGLMGLIHGVQVHC